MMTSECRCITWWDGPMKYCSITSEVNTSHKMCSAVYHRIGSILGPIRHTGGTQQLQWNETGGSVKHVKYDPASDHIFRLRGKF